MVANGSPYKRWQWHENRYEQIEGIREGAPEMDLEGSGGPN